MFFSTVKMKNQFLFDIFKAAELIKVYIYDVTPLKYEFKGIFKIYLVNTLRTSNKTLSISKIIDINNI